jgi:phage tail-like protein
MATSTINRFSKIATDPIRSFRFVADFRISSTAEQPFSNKIISTGPSGTSFTGGFTNISGLSIQTQSIGYREGGMNTTLHQVPGMTQFQPVTFQRGTIYGKDEAITWMRGLFGAASGQGVGLGGKTFRCDVDIYVLDHPAADISDREDLIANRAKMKFTIYNAWITSLNYSDLNAGDNQLLYETMTLVHEGLSVDFER